MNNIAKTMACAAVCAAAANISGCVYRIDVPQGNYIEPEQVEKLRIQMTKEQVKYVLGTPITIDPFHKNRWDYVFRIQEGWNDAEQKVLFVTFEGDYLVDIGGDYPKPADFNTPLEE